MFLFSLSLDFSNIAVVQTLCKIFIPHILDKVFCKHGNATEVLMEAQNCILDTVWSIYLYQEEMSHCNVCVLP